MARLTMMDHIRGVEDILGYEFRNHSLIWEALQAAGSPVFAIGNRFLVGGNKRMAVLGDKVLDLALAEAWHEGNDASMHFNRIRQTVANNQNLDRIGRETGLVAFVNLNPSSLGVVSPVTMSATVEAVLGAVYLDSDMDTVKRVMNALRLVPT